MKIETIRLKNFKTFEGVELVDIPSDRHSINIQNNSNL